jgi:signal transduction histidine kinase
MGEMRLHSQILLSMMNNMLELARIEAGSLQLIYEPTDIADLLGSVRDHLSYLAQKKSVAVNCTVERSVPVLLVSYETLRRILENLVSNAIKFANNGGLVEMSASFDYASDTLTFLVRDNGCGISSEDLPFVFNRFVQGKETAGRINASGSGLGLALVKELAELHGGKVAVESSIGEGSIFIVKVKAKVPEMENEDTVG